MKFKIGEIIKEGGPYGPISKIIEYNNGVYTVISLDGKAIGYLEEEYLHKYKQYEQLSLF